MRSLISPPVAIEGGRVSIDGGPFAVDNAALPVVRIGSIPARVSFASPSRMIVIVPSGLERGTHELDVEGVGAVGSVNIAGTFATGLHQVDNPVFDRAGNLYVTYSGTRGQQVPVSIFRVRPNGTRETFSSGIVNPTSMAVDPQGRLYVSSRFEGIVYRVAEDGTVHTFAADLGVACGLAFAEDGTLYVGDRTGTIFKVAADGQTTTFASLPASVAAFHLAYGPPGPSAALYVTGPTLSSYDVLYRIAADGAVTTVNVTFGRPQGLAFDADGRLHVIEALAGVSGLYRLEDDANPTMVLSGPGLIGVAFDGSGGFVVASNETAYRI